MLDGNISVGSLDLFQLAVDVEDPAFFPVSANFVTERRGVEILVSLERSASERAPQLLQHLSGWRSAMPDWCPPELEVSSIDEIDLVDSARDLQDQDLREQADELAVAISKSRSIERINEMGAKLAAIEAARARLNEGSLRSGLPGVWKGTSRAVSVKAAGSTELRLLAASIILALVDFAEDHGMLRAAHLRTF